MCISIMGEAILMLLMSLNTENIFYEMFLSLQLWGYFGPLALVIIGYVLVKKELFLGILWFIIECLFIGYYLDLVDATPQYWWHVYILLLGGLFTCVYPLWDRRR